MGLHLNHAADELPAIPEEHSTTTIIGAAHYWAGRAKTAEAEVPSLAKSRRRWRAFCAVVVLPYLPVIWAWLAG